MRGMRLVVALLGAVVALGSSASLAICAVADAAALAARARPAGPHQRRHHRRILRAAYSSFPDYLDPQLSFTQEGWTAMYDTYIPLLTFRHASGKAGSQVIPGLAESMPEITDGGRTYTLFLRKGLRYSNGRRVRASDFEFAVERMFRLHSGGAPFYMDIVGARDFARRGRGDISGIVTEDRTGKIEIHLLRPRVTFTDELALMFVAPVPPDTPIGNASASPPPATGPYAITRSRPGRSWTYARNPEWKRNGRLMSGLPDGHLARIRVTVIPNGSRQVDEVERGKLDWMFNPPPTDRYFEVRRRYLGAQFRPEPTLSLYYFWMNTTKPPFNDLRVRQAVNYAIDPRALQRIYAGRLTPSQQILPSEMPGYEKFELYPHDLAKAHQLIAEANPTDRGITVWTDNESPNLEATVYYTLVLRDLGFHARLKVVNGLAYFSVIGNTSTPNLDTGWSDWFEDYPHPNDFFEPLLAGSSILATNSDNFSQVNIPVLNEEIATLNEQSGSIPEAQYASLDRSYMEQAVIAPYGGLTLSTFVSKSIKLDKVIWNPTFGDDLTSFRFK